MLINDIAHFYYRYKLQAVVAEKQLVLGDDALDDTARCEDLAKITIDGASLEDLCVSFVYVKPPILHAYAHACCSCPYLA